MSTQPTTPDAPGRFASRYAPALAFGVPLAAYLKTMSRGLAWGDGIELAAVAGTLGIAHPTGYPLFTLLGHAFSWIPVGSVYWRVTLLCAVAMAGVSFLIFRMLQTLGDRLWTEAFPSATVRAAMALAGATAFALARDPWSHALIVEVYGVQLLVQFAVVALAWRVMEAKCVRAYRAMALCFGLGLTHHMLTLVVAPFAAAATLAMVFPGGWRGGELPSLRSLARLLLPAAGFFILGLTPLLYLPIRAAQAPALNWGDPSNLERLRWTLTGGEFRQFRFLMETPAQPFTAATYPAFFFGRVGEMARFVSGQAVAPDDPQHPLWFGLFLAAGVFLGLGFRRLWRSGGAARPWTLALGASVLIGLFFVFTYNILDIRDYELIILGLLWFALWIGVAELARWGANEWRRVGELHRAARVGGLLLAVPVAFFFLHLRTVDRSHLDTADLYAVRLMTALPPDALLLTAGDNDIYTAWYLQEVEQFRTDVLVYGANFIFSPWYEAYFRRRDLGGRVVAVEQAAPTTDVAFVEALGRAVVDPNLERFPVYSTLAIPALQRRYHLEPTHLLLTQEEYDAAVKRGEFPPPAVLYRITAPR